MSFQQTAVRHIFFLAWSLSMSAVLAASERPAAGDPATELGRVDLVLDLKSFSGPVHDLTFSPDGTMLAASGQKVVRIWDMRTGRLLRTLRGQADRDGTGESLAVAFSHNNCELVVGVRDRAGRGALRVYDIRKITEIKEMIPDLPAAVTDLAFSRDSRFLAVRSENGALTIFDWSLKRIAGTLEPTDGIAPPVATISFPWREPILLVQGADRFATLAVPGNQAVPLARYLPTDLLAWLESQSQSGGNARVHDLHVEAGSWTAIGTDQATSGDPYRIGIWSAPAAAPARFYNGHQNRITAMALDRSATLAASADTLGNVHVWNPRTGERHLVFPSQRRPIYGAVLDSNARRIGFTTTPAPAGDRKWNHYGTIDQVFDLDRRMISPAAADDFSAAMMAAPQNNLSVRHKNGQYDLQFPRRDGGPVTMPIRSGLVPTCCTLLQSIRSDGHLPVLIGARDGRLFVTDLLDQARQQWLVGHEASITSIRESADGRFLTTTSIDGTIRLWNLAAIRNRVATIDPLLSLLLTGRDQWILWAPRGFYDAAPGYGDRLGWHVNRGPGQSALFYPVHQFRNQLYRPDIVHQVLLAGDMDQALERVGISKPGRGPAIAAPAPLTTDLRKPQTMQAMQPPRIRILSPRDGLVTQEGSVHVLAEVVAQNELPITDVRVLVNGRPSLAKGVDVVSDDTTRRKKSSFSRAVQLLPGENQISVVAYNGVANSVPVTVSVQYDAPAKVIQMKPNLHLLSIGISEYANQNLNLRYAHLDAEAFAKIWDKQRGPVYDRLAKTVLVNQQASAKSIRDAMDQLAASVSQRDIAVIFISAHGIRDRSLEYYLATHEVDPDNLPGTGIHFSTITELLAVLPCKVLLLVDTCHAAGITGAKSIARDPLYEMTAAEYGAIVFTSSLAREISVEDEKWEHGAFTKAILDTLADRQSDINGDGYLSLTEFEQNVCDLVAEMTRGQQHPVMQRPATIHNIPFYYLGTGDPSPQVTGPVNQEPTPSPQLAGQ